MVTTRNGRPSDSKSMLIATPNFVVTRSPKRKAKAPEKRTVAASQNLEPRRLMETNRETKLRCIERYPRAMMTMSMVSACYMSQQEISQRAGKGNSVKVP